MSINYEIWGTPDTWIGAPYTGGETGQLAESLKITGPKCPDFGTESNKTRLNSGITAGRITANEPLDLTICPCGQDEKVSAYGKLAIFNENGDGSLTPRVVERDGPCNWFMFDQYESYDIEKMVIKRNYSYSSSRGMKFDQWSPNAVINSYNNNGYISPFVSWYTRSLVLAIQVKAFTSAGNSGTNGGWISLDAWKNSYSNENICGIRFITMPINSLNSTTMTLSYNNSSPTQDQHAGKIAILDTIPGINNNGTPTDTTFYSFFQTSDRGREGVIFDETYGSGNTTNFCILPCWEYFDEQEIKRGGNSSWGYYYYYSIPYSDDTYEKIMKMIACFGCYFTPSGKTSFPYAMTDSDLCLPIVDDNGITHGEYTRGADNVNNDLYDLESIRDKEYDPTKPPAPTPSGDPMLPEGLYFTMAGRGTGIWALTPTEIDQAWNDIFGSDVDVKMFGNNPMNAILSLKWTPFDWTQTGILDEGPIVLGDQTVNILHSYPMIKNVSNAEKHGYGTMKFQFDKNFYNARFMQARLFLPFYGYYELPAAQLLSSELRIDFYYNVPDELGVYIISYDNVIYDYVECSVDLDVPLTGSNAAAINESKRSQALSIASQVAATAATSIIGASTLAGFTGAGRYLASAIDVVAGETGVGFADVGLETENYFGGRGSGRAFTGSQAIGIGAGIAGAAASIANTVRNGKIERAALKTNLPYHGSALQTTFLHMSMKPYVQIFKNAIMEGLDRSGNGVDQTLGGNTEAQYKLKVGHACDIFTTANDMPENSLLQTTGIANMNQSDMELSEVQELNSILQSGFYK